MSIISPTVGRIVLFHPEHNTRDSRFAYAPTCAAIIAKVWTDTCVNLTVFDANGEPWSRTSVELVHDGMVAPNGNWCEWMPYQKGQAAKTEALESALAATKTADPKYPVPDDAIETEIKAKGKTAPRITPADLEANIASEHYFTAREGVLGMLAADGVIATTYERANAAPPSLGLLTFCVLVLRNGFTVTGESACASPENFDAEIGRKIARQNAVQKVWPLMGYALKDKLAAA